MLSAAAPMPRTEKTDSDLVSLQYLRGLAALMVVAVHINVQTSRAGLPDWFPEWMAAGVDIFFVISGCIMWITTAPPREIGPLRFYWKRITRIVPLYWLVTSVMVLALLIVPSVVQSGRLDPLHVILSYLFIPARHPALRTMEPIVVPGWTLNYEMFFYAIFGLLLLLPTMSRLLAMVSMMIALVVTGMTLGFATDSVGGFYTSSIMLEFAAGSVLGWLFLKKPLPAPSIAYLLVTGGAFLLPLLSTLLPDYPRALTYGVPATLIVGGALALERHRAVARFRLPHLLGDASYSVYLCHGMLLSAAGQFWRRAGLFQIPGGEILFAAFCLAFAACGGILLYLGFEKPTIRAFRSKSRVSLTA